MNMKNKLQQTKLLQLLFAFVIVFGISATLKAQTVFTQNESGIVAINAFDYTSLRDGSGTSSGSITTDNTVGAGDFINDLYLQFPTVTSGIGDAAVAYTDAVLATYTVNFTETGTYEVYTHMYMANGDADSFWFGSDNSSTLGRWETWTPNAPQGEWTWAQSERSDRVTISTTGEHTFEIYMRGQGGPLFDKLVLVKDGETFDGAAYVSNTDLYDLTVDGTTVTGFDAATLTYDVALPVGTTEVTVGAISVNDAAALAITNDGTITISESTATATIDITSEDGSATQTYTVNFTVTSASSDATLSDLTVDGTTVTGFDATTLTYEIMVPGGSTSATIAAAANDEAAEVTGTGAIDLTVTGSGSLDVLVTAEDGVSTHTYTVIVTVAAIYGDNLVYQQDDSGLLVINTAYYDSITPGINHEFMTTQVKEEGVISDEFLLMPAAGKYDGAAYAIGDGPEAHYTVNFNATGDYTVYALTNCPSGSEKSFWVKVPGTDYTRWEEWATYGSWHWSINDGTAYDGRYTLAVSSTGEQVFTLSQRGMNVKIDKLFITAEAGFDPELYLSADLSDLTIDDITIVDFDPAILSYDVVLPSGTETVTVGAVANNPDAGISGDGIVDVSTGSATVEVDVTSEDGATTNTYTINITVDISTALESDVFENVLLYPNPVTDKITITNISNAVISIYNIQGVLVANKKAEDMDLSIDVSALSAGMYVLKIEMDGTVKNMSFTKL